MDVRRIPVSKINPAPYNPRKTLYPSDKAYQDIKRSVEKFGLAEPLIWNEATGNLISGHQRFAVVVNEFGYTEVDVVVLGLSPREERALNVAMNKITGEWDIPKLKDLLVELDDGSGDFEPTGYTSEELEKLVADQQRAFEPALLDDQGKLDEKNKVECPSCGHRFAA